MIQGLNLVLQFPFQFGGKADGELSAKYTEVSKVGKRRSWARSKRDL